MPIGIAVANWDSSWIVSCSSWLYSGSRGVQGPWADRLANIKNQQYILLSAIFCFFKNDAKSSCCTVAFGWQCDMHFDEFDGWLHADIEILYIYIYIHMQRIIPRRINIGVLQDCFNSTHLSIQFFVFVSRPMFKSLLMTNVRNSIAWFLVCTFNSLPASGF